MMDEVLVERVAKAIAFAYPDRPTSETADELWQRIENLGPTGNMDRYLRQARAAIGAMFPDVEDADNPFNAPPPARFVNKVTIGDYTREHLDEQ